LQAVRRKISLFITCPFEKQMSVGEPKNKLETTKASWAKKQQIRHTPKKKSNHNKMTRKNKK
jgi:hypothetical protein